MKELDFSLAPDLVISEEGYSIPGLSKVLALYLSHFIIALLSYLVVLPSQLRKPKCLLIIELYKSSHAALLSLQSSSETFA